MKVALLALLLLLTPPLCAQDTEVPAKTACVTVESPTSCRIGELVRLDASMSVADSISWILVPESVLDIEVYDSGRRAVFSARVPGEYRFIVACAKDGTVDVKTFTIIAVGPPEAPLSDSLAEWIPFWAYPLKLSSEDAGRLAASFEEVAARTDLTTPATWIEATAISNRAALGDNLSLWKPILNKIGEALLKKAQAGELTTPEQHREMWLQIASGLRKV